MSLRCEHQRGTKPQPPAKSLWLPIAVSPPRAPSRSPTLLLECKDGFCLDGKSVALEVPHLSYITPTWLYPHELQTALIFFDQDDSDDPTLLRDFPRRVFMNNFVRMNTERVDSLEWRPLIDDLAGTRGFCFLLGNNDEPVIRFEVELEGDELAVVRVVHVDYSPLKFEAGVVARSSFLEFKPKTHLDAMRSVLANIRSDDDFVYMPTSEFVACAAFHKLILKRNHLDDDSARKVWQTLKRFVASLSELTVQCTNAFNSEECRRSKCSAEFVVDSAVVWS